MKECKKCKEEKQVDLFPITGKGYISNTCRACTSVYKKQLKLRKRKICSVCNVNKRGHKAKSCRSCASKANHIKMAERAISTNKTCNNCDADYVDESFFQRKEYCSDECQKTKWYESNKHLLADRYREVRRKWKTENESKRRDYYDARRKANPHIYRAKTAKRRAAKLNATIPGYDAELKSIYEKCPKDHHVDHIVPLRNSKVCGLHVPWNLQYLTPEENLKKSNKLIDDLL